MSPSHERAGNKLNMTGREIYIHSGEIEQGSTGETFVHGRLWNVYEWLDENR